MFKMVAILDFQSKQLWLFLIHKWPRYFLSSFGQLAFLFRRTHKTDFQDGSHGSCLVSPIRTILASFFFWPASLPDTSYQALSQLALRFRRRHKTLSRWQPWQLSWISDQNNFSFFLTCKSPWYILPSFKSIGLLVQNKTQNRLSRWQPWKPSWISNQNEFSFLTRKPSWYFLPSFQSIGLLVQKFKIDFHDGRQSDDFEFPIGMILAIFDL